MRLAKFTVQLELGPETRALVERIVERSAIRIELGERTLEVVRELVRRERTDDGSR